jgi:hypothetical protein
MKRTARFLSFLFAVSIVAPLLSSCSSNDEFQERMDRRNDSYMRYNDRRRIRLDARQERTDAWFDRHMH